MKWVVPGCDSHYDSQGNIFNPSIFMHHHWPGWSIVGPEPIFTPFTNSSNFFTRRQDFSQDSVHLWFTRFPSRNATYIFHVIDDVFLDRSQNQPALCKGGISPLGLSNLGLIEYCMNFLGRHIFTWPKNCFVDGSKQQSFDLSSSRQSCISLTGSPLTPSSLDSAGDIVTSKVGTLVVKYSIHSFAW